MVAMKLLVVDWRLWLVATKLSRYGLFGAFLCQSICYDDSSLVELKVICKIYNCPFVLKR